MRLNRRIAAAGVVVAGLGLGSPALAEAPTYVKVQPPRVEAASFGQSSQEASAGSSQCSTTSGSSGSSSPLALTGGDIIGVTALGLGLVGSGVVVRQLGRRRSLGHPA